MAASSYASSLGRLKPYFPEFLPKEQVSALLEAKDVGEIIKLLEPTAYGADLTAARASYQGAPLVEIAINRTLVRRLQQAHLAAPFAGRPLVGAYLGRWDLQNIELILAAKALDRSILEAEHELVSSREVPAGSYGGVLTLDDLRGLLAQPTLEAVAHALLPFGYGATILARVEAFRRTRDIFPIATALQREYYQRLTDVARFFQGDEWVVREFLRSEIDLHNVLLLLKGKAADGVRTEDVSERWIAGGRIAEASVPDLFGAQSVPALAERLRPSYPSISEGDEAFASDATLTGYEGALSRDHAVAEIGRMRMYPLSLSIIFQYLLLAELERSDIRRITFGLVYGVPKARIGPWLVIPRL
ncbi:MAG: V-type ATPase subunit [Thermoplasmata archaeon]|nr:V-type ATPase subunit [Thermoplasmata archaeon]MCI4359546.1 V-type ATPase subunit [Thermoplasmata archaeon]